MIILLLVLSTIVLDFYYAKLHNSAFYFSESLLFSSFWFLFLPLLLFQNILLKVNQKPLFSIFILAFIILLHFLSYPGLVWFISKLFYSYNFPYWQTFSYELTEYSLIIVIIYSFALCFSLGIKKTDSSITLKNQIVQLEYITSLIVTESDNSKISIQIADIQYFSANTPYVTIHYKNKKYLLSQALKSLETTLNSVQFVRIHKSCIVNISFVRSFKSRLNGDYDLTLTDNTVLRISRNYAAEFKRIFTLCHHDKSR
jgi:hypothetical protein